MYLKRDSFYQSKQQTLYIDLQTASNGIVEMIKTELPPGLKYNKVEDVIAHWNVDSDDFNPCAFFEFERAFGVSCGLRVELRPVWNSEGRIILEDRKLNKYELRVEIGASGTNYNVVQAVALHALQGRIIEFAANIECMFDDYPIYKTTMIEVAETVENVV